MTQRYFTGVRSAPCGSPNGDHGCNGTFQLGPPSQPERRSIEQCQCECHKKQEDTRDE